MVMFHAVAWTPTWVERYDLHILAMIPTQCVVLPSPAASLSGITANSEVNLNERDERDRGDKYETENMNVLPTWFPIEPMRVWAPATLVGWILAYVPCRHPSLA